jgi:hypothetical protein
MERSRPHQAAMLFVCLVFVSNELHADVIPGRWDKVHSQAAGTDLVIKLKAGERIEGSYDRADPDNIIVRDQQGVERRIRKMDVARVEAGAGPPGSGRRGALIGAVAGAAPMAALGALLGHGFGGGAGDTAQGAAILGGLGAGIGALVGYAVGKAHKDAETLYVAPDRESSRP